MNLIKVQTGCLNILKKIVGRSQKHNCKQHFQSPDYRAIDKTLFWMQFKIFSFIPISTYVVSIYHIISKYWDR